MDWGDSSHIVAIAIKSAGAAGVKIVPVTADSRAVIFTDAIRRVSANLVDLCLHIRANLMWIIWTGTTQTIRQRIYKHCAQTATA